MFEKKYISVLPPPNQKNKKRYYTIKLFIILSLKFSYKAIAIKRQITLLKKILAWPVCCGAPISLALLFTIVRTPHVPEKFPDENRTRYKFGF